MIGVSIERRVNTGMNIETSPEKTGYRTAISVRNLFVFYGEFKALDNVSLDIPEKEVTAFIGPSGCGKSTLLRAINRMNEVIPQSETKGEILFHSINIYDRAVDPVELRRRIGMVFQKPNPFPRSIYDNIAWGAKINGYKGDMDDLVEETLKKSFLWDEVKDKLRQNALRLSGGQQQRLCIARALAIEPEIILMDEPASALDPISTSKIEDLICELKKDYTIIIVTHNMQQAARVSGKTAFFLINEKKEGYLVEYDETKTIFFRPQYKVTEDYITGRFG